MTTYRISFKAVSIGQMPQGCTITVVADDSVDEFDIFPEPKY